ncbi:MAG: RNA polymerase sigma-54 factor [Sumerlaeia bacterium]
MALNLSQVMRQTQRLIMTPQMQQSIQLLQLNSIELEQMIQEEMLENPFLELSDDEENLRSKVDESGQDEQALEVADSGLSDQEKEKVKNTEESADADYTGPDEQFSDLDPNVDRMEVTSSADDFEHFEQSDVDWNNEYYDSDTSAYASTHEDVEENDFTTYTSIAMNLTDSLMRQLRLSILEGEELEIGEFIVGNLNNDGFVECGLDNQCLMLGYPPDLISIKGSIKSDDRLRIILEKLQGEGNREHINQLKRKQLVASIVGELLKITADEAMAMSRNEWMRLLIARRLRMSADEVMEITKEELVLKTIASRLKTDEQTVFDVLEVIHDFEPTGVGARNLSECLRLQCEEKEIRNKLLYIILDDHLEDLQQKRFREIARALEVNESQVQEVFHIISRLDPRPGQSTSTDTPRYITPDVYVKKVEGKYMYFLNEGDAGNLRVAANYQEMVEKRQKGQRLPRGAKKQALEMAAAAAAAEEKKANSTHNGTAPAEALDDDNSIASPAVPYNSEFPLDEHKVYAHEKYKNAVWLIKNIEKRKSTVLRVTEAIMNYQNDFLDKGIEYLHPLTLRNIAEVVGMHESTIARVTTGKYVETPRGIFQLKYFFSSGLETDSGDDASSRSIKEMITQMIDGENEKKPLSDQKIADMLKIKGIQIARRTVAKYREQLKILPAKLRKSVAKKVK